MGMEDDTREFLVRIVNTISIVLLWMMTCVFFGIFLGYGFFEDFPDWKNIVFYISFLVSLFFLIRHLMRKWKL
jgi:ABC-type glycerol-3-phosphate transport system permease component